MNTNHKIQILFREVQRFRQWWLWILAVGLPLLGTMPLIYGFYQQIILGIPWPARKDPMDDITLVIVTGIMIVVNISLPIWIYFTKLITEVRSDGVYIWFVPFHWSFQRISLDTVRAVHALTYRPMMEYGGWGIRYCKKGKAYNVSGNRGVRLDFSDGKHLLIGSQVPDELAQALEQSRQSSESLEKKP
jgi:hypothetical protein